MKSRHSGIMRILKAFVYSYDGFRAAFKSEAAFRQDLLFCAFGAVAIPFIPADATEKILLGFSLFFVLFAELVNTAIEALTDLASPNYHELAKTAKDIGSLLVLLSYINVAIFWGMAIYKIL